MECVIVDDEQDSIELLANRLQKLYKNITIANTFSNWEHALEHLRSTSPDILFLDISMPAKNGLNLLQLLPQLTSEIIFVTAYDSYALKAFAFSATGYVLKPIDDLDLTQAVDKAIERANNRKKAGAAATTGVVLNEKIGIPNGPGTDFINVNDIIYLESNNKCTYITTKTAKLISALNIGRFQYITEQHQNFYQVHRSFIINLNHITRYESSGNVIMSDKRQIPVARSERTDLTNLLNNKFDSVG